MIAIDFKNVTKRFGDCVSNRNVSFQVVRGSIHGLIGENGAGKSTAMKVLFGIYPPDEGQIKVFEKPMQIRSPIQAMKLGIGMVHQHFMLAEPETVLDNIILGHEPGWWPGILQRDKARKQLEAIAQNYGLKFKNASVWDQKISELSVGEQQRVEILKLLYQKSEILILDEPTAVLTPQEVKELFQNLLRLKQEGKTIVLISHKLKEVLEFTDQVTVMRRGEIVGTIATKDATETSLAEMMVGRQVSFSYQGPRRVLANAKDLRPLLELSDVSIFGGTEPCQKVSFQLRPGEILGVGGVQGNGQSELLRFLSNPKFVFDQGRKKLSGDYRIGAQSVLADGPIELRSRGVGLVPEDRLAEAVLAQQDMVENFLLGQHQDKTYASPIPGILNRKVVRGRVVQAIQKYDIRPTEPEAIVGKMSGGNQQKLVMSRALDVEPKILLVAHPTRGVDVGAIEVIHEALMKQRNAGKAILLFSTELDELMDLSDRLLVFYEGKVNAEFARGGFDPWKIGLAMGGGSAG